MAAASTRGEAPNENGPAEAATSPDRGSNNPYQESVVNTATDTTVPPGAATETNWFERFCDHDTVLHQVYSLADLAYTHATNSVSRDDLDGPFQISERDLNCLTALLNAIDQTLARTLRRAS